MGEAERSVLVAVINSNQEIIHAIRMLLDNEGIASIGAHVQDFKQGSQDWVAFLKSSNPKVIIYDIAPPYEENWIFFQLLKESKETQGRQFLLTTTNKVALEKLTGTPNIIEILSKPFDLDEMLTLTKQMLHL